MTNLDHIKHPGLTESHYQIMRLRDNGKTFAEIGLALGFSAQNCHVKYTAGKWMLKATRLDRTTGSLFTLPDNTQKVLRRESITHRDDAVAAIKDGDISPKTHGLSVKSFEALCEWLGLKTEKAGV